MSNTKFNGVSKQLLTSIEEEKRSAKLMRILQVLSSAAELTPSQIVRLNEAAVALALGETNADTPEYLYKREENNNAQTP